MVLVDTVLDWIGRSIAETLEAPLHDSEPLDAPQFDMVRRVLRPADVLLVEGRQKLATAIKYLVWGFCCQQDLFRIMSFLCSIWQASRFVVRTHTMERAGARVGTVKDGVLSATRKVLDGLRVRWQGMPWSG
jgi:hypothetical protein